MKNASTILIAASLVALGGVGAALYSGRAAAPASSDLPAVATTSAPAAILASHVEAGDPVPITVYHSPTCGCCKEWVKHMEQHGFTARIIQQEDLAPIKTELGVTSRLRSCHTAVVGSYVIEGHVPAADVKRLLAEKPKVVGLTAPGMPASAPGMDQGTQPYDVLSWDATGKTEVWARH
jgi:hypothetical protein